MEQAVCGRWVVHTGSLALVLLGLEARGARGVGAHLLGARGRACWAQNWGMWGTCVGCVAGVVGFAGVGRCCMMRLAPKRLSRLSICSCGCHARRLLTAPKTMQAT